VARSDEEIAQLCSEFLSTDDISLQAGELLLRDRLAGSSSAIRHELVLNLLGQGKPQEIFELTDLGRVPISELSQVDCFNLAMARWAVDQSAPIELFQRVIDLGNDGAEPSSSANYAQCLSIAHWLTGNIEQARTSSNTARNTIVSRGTPEFSCWQYRKVSPEAFIEDLVEINRAISGQKVLPRFMSTEMSADRRKHD
jgi:hypothetical protein